ncbi:MAG TPA: hypothetical protein PKU78_01890 [Candidatus Dojkabacteria bacterium]|nr:hypothetical protein [Candidatus Dojkabacteria bacterium]HRO64947.1 hypothetical protein [Candidatus Dojkabacteria bacterium]HRP37801.1 hypothetical protein [Candidatus Dojkabacteria bacterium]HRP50732.1 hypothetical protein [Candidatus Dojkabacteria bacterium]
MNPEVFEVPRTLVSTLTAVLNKALLYGIPVDFNKRIDGIDISMTREFNPDSQYNLDTRSVSLEKGIYRYDHNVEIQKLPSRESCNLYYLMYISGRVVSNIIGSGNQSQLQILSLNHTYPSPIDKFRDFGFLQRPAPDDTRSRRLF